MSILDKSNLSSDGFETVMSWLAHFLYTHENVLPLLTNSFPTPPKILLSKYGGQIMSMLMSIGGILIVIALVVFVLLKFVLNKKEAIEAKK